MNLRLTTVALLLLACGKGVDTDKNNDTGETSVIDNDNDGFSPADGDCDDGDSNINPNAEDVPGNGIDEDCSGSDEAVSDLQSLTSGDLVISELMNNPDIASDNDGEYIEIYNNSGRELNLKGLSVGEQDEVDFTIETDLQVSVGGYLVIGASDDMSVNGGFEPNYVSNSFKLGNGEDSVALSYEGVVIDVVAYDDGVTFPDPKGYSMNLSPEHLDASANDLGENWCVASSSFGSGDFGTPGAANDSCSVVQDNDADNDGYDADVDCDDTDPSINPGAVEIENDGIDQNCDGIDAQSGDNDGDGFGPGLDCDDGDADINPNAVDYDNDGIDQDCDGSDLTFGACSDDCIYANDGECDDGGPFADYTACDFGSDCSDCGPRLDEDQDGFYASQGVEPLNPNLELDCNDTDPSVYPGAVEIESDEIDQDCNGFDAIADDNDGDGYPLGVDCDDDNALIYPGAIEIPYDGIDQDCDGSDLGEICDDSCATDNDGVCDDGGFLSDNGTCALGSDCSDCGGRIDQDGDGYDEFEDCNDATPLVSPGNTQDICDGLDNDCDAYIDEDTDPTELDVLGSYMGTLDQSGDTVEGESYITSATDIDVFTLYLIDGFDWAPPDDDDFSCTFESSAAVDIAIQVTFTDEDENSTFLGSVDDVYGGDIEEFSFNASWGSDDNGEFSFAISTVSGESCSEAVLVSCTKD